jgi:hypothetical protein
MLMRLAGSPRRLIARMLFSDASRLATHVYPATGWNKATAFAVGWCSCPFPFARKGRP